MTVDFPDRLREWKASAEFAKLEEARWQTEAREAQKRGVPIPLPPATTAAPEPQMPRLLQHDVTIEKVAILLATAAPEGLLICRDELVGWIDGMTNYNEVAAPSGSQHMEAALIASSAKSTPILSTFHVWL